MQLFISQKSRFAFMQLIIPCRDSLLRQSRAWRIWRNFMLQSAISVQSFQEVPLNSRARPWNWYHSGATISPNWKKGRSQVWFLIRSDLGEYAHHHRKYLVEHLIHEGSFATLLIENLPWSPTFSTLDSCLPWKHETLFSFQIYSKCQCLSIDSNRTGDKESSLLPDIE